MDEAIALLEEYYGSQPEEHPDRARMEYLLALMQVENFHVSVSAPEEVYKVWCDFKAVPMVGNVQLIFFRKAKGAPDDILVKVLHNEREAYYRGVCGE